MEKLKNSLHFTTMIFLGGSVGSSHVPTMKKYIQNGRLFRLFGAPAGIIGCRKWTLAAGKWTNEAIFRWIFETSPILRRGHKYNESTTKSYEDIWSNMK